MKSTCFSILNSQTNLCQRRLTSAGFSVVEMLLALGTLAILFGAIYAGFEKLNRYYTAENVKAGAQQSVRIGVEMMVQDIRLAGLDPLRTAGAGIIMVSNDTSIRFTSDLNFDGDLDDPLEDISYALTGSDLKQTNHNVSPDAEVLLENVADLTFTYFDQNGNLIPVAQLATRRLDIRTVGIALTVNRPAGRYQEVSRTYSTQVRCRNL
jgi:type IV pilus assembly protein PilW